MKTIMSDILKNWVIKNDLFLIILIVIQIVRWEFPEQKKKKIIPHEL